MHASMTSTRSKVKVKVMELVKLRKSHFSRSISYAIFAWSSKVTVDSDSMGPVLQLVWARLWNFLLEKLSWEFRLRRMYVLCMLRWPWPDPRSTSRSLTLTFWSSENLRTGRGYNIVIVIAGRPQQAVHAGGNDCQPSCGAFLFNNSVKIQLILIIFGGTQNSEKKLT